MWSKIKESRPFALFLAIAVAIISWLYVDLAQKPEAHIKIQNIPVTFIGEETLSDSDLLLVNDSASITITVSGTRSVITKLNRNNISITASLSSVKEAGVYTIDCNITLPSAVTSATSSPVRIVSRSASAVDVTVVPMVSRTVPIRAKFTGTVQNDCYYDDDSFVLQQKELEIRGEESEVDSVGYAEVVLSENNLADTWTGWLPITLYTQDGQELHDTDKIKMETSALSVAFYLDKTKTLDFNVDLVSGGGATAANAACTFDPPNITVFGQAVVLERLTSIDLGSIDLSQIVTTGEYTFPLELPTGTSAADGTPTEINVTVSISGLETRRLITSNVKLENAPEGYTYKWDNPEIRVRGLKENFSALMNDDIQVTLDLSQVEFQEGEAMTVPAKVEIVGISELGVLGSYNVNVTATPETPEDTAPAPAGN